MSQKLDLNYPYGTFRRGIVRWSREEILSITSRWNYGDDENDDFLTRELLHELLPETF